MKAMLLRLGAVALGLILISLASPPAYAGVIYFGGAPNQEGLIYAQYPPYAVLMSFTLAPGTNVVTGAEWYGSCGSTACGASPKFTIAIYTDDGGLPGTFLLIRNVGSADQTAIGNGEYEYSVTFPSKTLTPGTPYLFGVYVSASSEPADVTWGIEETSKAPHGATTALFDMTISEDWSLIQENGAFSLTGPGAVPEPSIWAMLLIGFAGLGFQGYRRTVKARFAA
jgi:hypothetical protein